MLIPTKEIKEFLLHILTLNGAGTTLGTREEIVPKPNVHVRIYCGAMCPGLSIPLLALSIHFAISGYDKLIQLKFCLLRLALRSYGLL